MKKECYDAPERSIYRFLLIFLFHILLIWQTQIIMEDFETVALAGTSLHKALTVLADEWESTVVEMFVTSSYGHILPKELANTGLFPPTKILASAFEGAFELLQNKECAREKIARKELCFLKSEVSHDDL